MAPPTGEAEPSSSQGTVRATSDQKVQTFKRKSNPGAQLISKNSLHHVSLIDHLAHLGIKAIAPEQCSLLVAGRLSHFLTNWRALTKDQ